MQLAVPPPEVLLPLGAGVAVLVVALIVLLLVRGARRRRAAVAPDASPTVAEAVREAEWAAGPTSVDPVSEPVVVDPEGPVRSEPVEGPWRKPAQGVGSGRTVAAAVAQAFAAREVHARNDGASAGPRGDARDRLLAVLLDDPVRAVGAAVELEACRRQLDRLTDAVQHERATLGDVLGRLSSAGLASDQLARLSGLSDDELRLLMQERAGAR